MPRSLHYTEPSIINRILHADNLKYSSNNYLEIATTNQAKLRELRAILTGYTIVGRDIEVEEIQSLDALKVVTEKAKAAYAKNNYNPVIVEDTSLEINGLNKRPGSYAKDFTKDFQMRELITKVWLRDQDRHACARVLMGIFDGIEVHIFEGKCDGTIAEKPRGTQGFGWDDIFIPDGDKRTFAEMTAREKNKYSMRRQAAEKFIKAKLQLNYPVYCLPEPYEQELKRVHKGKLTHKAAIKFAYSLEPLEQLNKPNPQFTAPNYSPIVSDSNIYFNRYLTNDSTKSLGLMLTDVDRKALKCYQNGNPVIWQMGPERRHLALVQRAEYFLMHQNPRVNKILNEMENAPNFRRPNRRSTTVEMGLGMSQSDQVLQSISLKELGYKKKSTTNLVSRTKASQTGLFNKIGKYPRSIFAVGSLPFISGWRDVITTTVLGHMLVFTHRNNLNAISFKNQLQLIESAIESIKKLKLSKKAEARALRNIGAAIGSNPDTEIEKVKALVKLGVKAFRVYTINSDQRILKTATLIRQTFGDEVELFVGQIADKEQALKLIGPDVKVDGLIFGHGGGRQCTSAINGMALATLEEIYQITIDPQFNNTSVLVEGGISTYIGALLILGVDCILRNAQFASCVIEQGDIVFEHKSGKFCQPYHGSASAATMIIEAKARQNRDSRLFYSGRTKKVEGKSGYIFYKERANSMAYYVEEFKHYASRTLVDLGVESIKDLREMLTKSEDEFLRLVSADAQYLATAYRS